MKKTKTTFLLAEICLGILLLFCVHLIFEDEKPQKRVDYSLAHDQNLP